MAAKGSKYRNPPYPNRKYSAPVLKAPGRWARF